MAVVMSLTLVLDILALCCFLVAAFQVPVPRVNLGWLGLFFWMLGVILAR
jgi:hypothetical protein